MMATDRFREGTKGRLLPDELCSAIVCMNVMLGVCERTIYVPEVNLCV